MTTPIEALTDRELQSLRNLGNEAEAAADEIVWLRAAPKQSHAVVKALRRLCAAVKRVQGHTFAPWMDELDAAYRQAVSALAQAEAQSAAEPDPIMGLPFAEAKARIMAMPLDDARSFAVSLAIQLGIALKYAGAAQPAAERGAQ